jgi:hypothetical protein
MRHFFGSMMAGNNEPALDNDIAALVIFDFDAKQDSKFTLRTDSGVDYVVDYTDRGITVAQAIASKQPVKLSDDCYFNGIGSHLFNPNLGQTPQEIWSVATYDLPLAKQYDGLVTLSNSGYIPLVLDLNSTSFLALGGGTRVNNISTNIFLPALTKKTVSDFFGYIPPQPTQLWIGQDRGFGFRSWQGNISRLILFSAELTTDQRNRLQTYLQAYHEFTP